MVIEKREKRKSENVLLRLLILTESIASDFERLVYNHGMMHFLPGEVNEKFRVPFDTKTKTLESNISKYYELLLLNQIISDEEVKKILRSLAIIEENLFELLSYPVVDLDSLNDTLAMKNPINKEIENIQSIVQRYDK